MAHGRRRAERARELPAPAALEQREGVGVEVVAEIEAFAPVTKHQLLHAYEPRGRDLVQRSRGWPCISESIALSVTPPTAGGGFVANTPSPRDELGADAIDRRVTVRSA